MRPTIIVAALLASVGCAPGPSSDLPTEARIREVMAGRATPGKDTDPHFVTERAAAEYRAGRHVNAAHLYRLAAIQDYAPAQAALAGALLEGRGVPQNYAEAYRWAKEAAEQGNAQCQALIGAMLAEGHGAPRDPIRSYMWLTLALPANVDPRVPQLRDQIATALTRPQLADAQRMAREWRRR